MRGDRGEARPELAQAALVHWSSSVERPPAKPDLHAFPQQIGNWNRTGFEPVDDGTKAQLGADDGLADGVTGHRGAEIEVLPGHRQFDPIGDTGGQAAALECEGRQSAIAPVAATAFATSAKD